MGIPEGRELDQAPAPGQVGKRLIEGFTQRELPTGGPGREHGHALVLRIKLGGALRDPGRLPAQAEPPLGLPFGAVIWVSDYVLLPEAGLYKPIWEYDAKTLAGDLSAHLGYGAGTGTAFWLITRIWR